MESRIGAKGSNPSHTGSKGSQDGSAWWLKSLSGLLEELCAPGTGLTHAEARTRLKHYGLNEFRDRPDRPLWLEFLRRFSNPLVLILIAASVISALTGEVASFLIIVVMVVVDINEKKNNSNNAFPRKGS